MTATTSTTSTTGGSDEKGPDDASGTVWAPWYVFFYTIVIYLLTAVLGDSHHYYDGHYCDGHYYDGRPAQTTSTTRAVGGSDEKGPDDASCIVWAPWYVFFIL